MTESKRGVNNKLNGIAQIIAKKTFLLHCGRRCLPGKSSDSGFTACGLGHSRPRSVEMVITEIAPSWLYLWSQEK
jgi:hypothetical protein